jgi:hypothetical protein
MKLPTLTLIALLLFTSIAYADKLAPPANKLQPLPANVQPAVSQSVQRTASPEDIQSVQQAQASQPAPDSSVAPANAPIVPDVPAAPVSNIDLIVIIVAILAALGIAVVWLWQTF